MTFLADEKIIFNKDDLSLITILTQDYYYVAKKIFTWISSKNFHRIIEPIDSKTWYHLISR